MELSIYKDLINGYLSDMSSTVAHGPLKAMVDKALQSGGKRIRPIMCLLGYHLFRDDYEKALPQASAVEMFHAFSLVHDDIMDEAPTRRGLPSIYHAHGRDHAILTGDVMLILALQHAMKGVSDDVGQQVHQTLSAVAIEVCEGQMMDMDFEKITMPSRADYMTMIEKKTSVLLGAAIKMGGQVAGASTETCDALYAYGLKQGLAFQVQDDYLDAYGETDKIGKQKGGDIIQGKKTLLSILCAERMGDGGERIASILNDKTMSAQSKVESTMRLYNEHDIPSAINEIKQSLIADANQDLAKINARETSLKPLLALSNWLLKRNY